MCERRLGCFITGFICNEDLSFVFMLLKKHFLMKMILDIIRKDLPYIVIVKDYMQSKESQFVPTYS